MGGGEGGRRKGAFCGAARIEQNLKKVNVDATAWLDVGLTMVCVRN